MTLYTYLRDRFLFPEMFVFILHDATVSHLLSPQGVRGGHHHLLCPAGNNTKRKTEKESVWMPSRSSTLSGRRTCREAQGHQALIIPLDQVSPWGLWHLLNLEDPGEESGRRHCPSAKQINPKAQWSWKMTSKVKITVLTQSTHRGTALTSRAWFAGHALPKTVETGSVISIAQDAVWYADTGPHARTRMPASPEKYTYHHTRAPFSPLAPGNPGNPVEP